MDKKIGKKSEYSIGEGHYFILPNSALEKIFMEEFNNKFYAEYVCSRDENELIINDDYYNCYLYIEYREDEKKNMPENIPDKSNNIHEHIHVKSKAGEEISITREGKIIHDKNENKKIDFTNEVWDDLLKNWFKRYHNDKSVKL